MITVKGYLIDKKLPKGYTTKKRLRTTDTVLKRNCAAVYFDFIKQ